MVCHELVPTIVGDRELELDSIGQGAVQSCVFGVLQHVVGYSDTKLSSPRFRPRLACHEANGIEGAIATYEYGKSRKECVKGNSTIPQGL